MGDKNTAIVVANVEPEDAPPEEVERLNAIKMGTSDGVKSHGDSEQSTKQRDSNESLLGMVMQNTIINNAVTLYEQTKSQHPKFTKHVEVMGRKASTMVRKTSEFWGQTEGREKHYRDEGYDTATPLDDEDLGTPMRFSKRQKIKENFKEYRLNMSIESKKQLITCLHLLKLANKKLSDTVASLQDLVQKEITTAEALPARDVEDDENEQFYDASETLVDDRSKEIKMEVVGTVKKVYSLISQCAGNSLPEPARTQVRETLLKLPVNWNSSVNSTSKLRTTDSRLSTNNKILILAEESLEMVGNVIQVFDGTIGKAEEWVKHKQELKEMIKAQYLEAQLKIKVKQQLEKEKAEREEQELKTKEGRRGSKIGDTP
ncbi:HHR172Wp [Eremothecium sinecaudum]|uniref:HHR172Wp n=1 Tax=Eremothecium sinecaudum TaxID=45286 RepID=A0A0X8HWT4_9SACH|nr:HHR172Wp [Eremothecium sinecaudum]AMD22941.1 HHR172Wp [Eremothecium sinecaudum]